MVALRRFAAPPRVALTLAIVLALGAAPSSAADVAHVRMTTFGTCGEIWNWWAQAKGIYAKHGLEVEQVRSTGGAAALAAVVSNSVDFGYVNGFTTIIGASQDLPLIVVSAAQVTAMPPLPSAQGVWVRADSPIRTPSDLRGKKVGVNEVAGLTQIVTSAWLKRRGVDPAGVRFVALPPADLIPAVINGTLDAASSPALRALAAGPQIRLLRDQFVDLGTKVLISDYVTSRDFLAKNPQAAASFHDAIKEAIQQVNDPANHDAAYDVMAAGCKGDAAVLRKIPDNANAYAIDMGEFRRMGQFLLDQGILTKLPDLGRMVPPFARR